MLNFQSLFKKLGISALAICMLGSLGGEQGEYALRDALAPALIATGTARLYFVTQCSTRLIFGHEESYPRLPRLTLAPNSVHATNLEAVQEVFRNDKDAIVTEDRSGMIRITIGAVPAALLNTRIARLTFEPLARWNSMNAIEAIENASEVTAAMGRLNLEVARLGFIERLVTPPGDNRLPHLPPSLQNVTMDEALDAVASVFRQLVTYGECTQPDNRGVLSVYNTPLAECDSHLQGNPCFVPEAKMGRPTPLELSPDPSLSPNPYAQPTLRPLPTRGRRRELTRALSPYSGHLAQGR